MLVRFESSVTGELLTFAETAKLLLDILHKESTARGTFTLAEMAPAAQVLREAISHSEGPPPEEDEEDETGSKKVVAVGLRQRAWPLIDMLERTAKAGAKANIVWEAARDF